MRKIERRLPSQRSARPGIDSLLGRIDATESLAARIDWLINLFTWLRKERSTHVDAKFRFIFSVLERNEGLKYNVASTVRSIIRDINALDLFVSTGISSKGHFFPELYERLIVRIIPTPPRYNDFAEIFHLLFPSTEDAEWILQLSEQSLQQIANLLRYKEEDDQWNSIYSDMKEAIFYLTRQIQVQSFAPEIRVRIGKNHIADLAFYQVDRCVGAVLLARQNGESTETAVQDFRRVLADCHGNIASAYQHLDQRGVSVGLVYQLERLQAQMRRIESLIKILTEETQAPVLMQHLFYDLAVVADQQRSVRALFLENLALLSRKIVEHNAETGDHYISRRRSEYISLIKSSMGGGLITVLTVLAKTNVEHLKINYFAKGILASSVYAISFVAIQLCGFTLATKQPAMTAPALATKVRQLIDSKNYDGVVDEATHLTRSQVLSIFGNIITVAPILIVFEVLYHHLVGEHLLDTKYAAHVIKAHSIFGLTPLFAVFTGVLLFLSSLTAGWIGNWFIYREIPTAIEHNKKIKRILGWQRARNLANFLRKNTAGFGGNISLGLLLGMSPKLAAFFGILIDVRHVTLSTGSVALAAAVLGPDELSGAALALAISGLVLAGILNVGVSFGLALSVANRSQRLKSAQRYVLYRKIFMSFIRAPWRFLLPI